MNRRSLAFIANLLAFAVFAFTLDVLVGLVAIVLPRIPLGANLPCRDASFMDARARWRKFLMEK